MRFLVITFMLLFSSCLLHSQESSATVKADGSLLLSSVDSVINDTSRLTLIPQHNTSGNGVFLKYYPGDIAIPENNQVIPYVLHQLYGGNPVGFNQEKQSDYVYFFGLNPQGFTEYDSIRGGLGFSWELFFDQLDSTKGRQEWHMLHYLPEGEQDGSGGRFISYEGFEEQTQGSSIAFATGRDDVPSQGSVIFRTQEGEERIVYRWGNNRVDVENQINFSFNENDYGVLNQSTATGINSVELLRLDDNDDVALANQGYVFQSDASIIHTNGQFLQLGSHTFPIQQAPLFISDAQNNVLRLKRSDQSETLLIRGESDKWTFGTEPGQTSQLVLYKNTPAGTLSLTDQGQIVNGGFSSGYGRIVSGGLVGGVGMAANGINNDDAAAFYANGTGGTDVYLFRSDLTATNKVIGGIKNYGGDVELRLNATSDDKTAVVKYVNGANSWSVGVDKSNGSLYIYNGGDKLSGGTAIIEYTNDGQTKFLNLPEYVDEAAADAGGLTSGSMYKTPTGELRIKL